MATSVLTLEQLPDDVLEMVLQYVPMDDVLTCRLVSKRLCGLALHWGVWRHRSLKDDDPHAGAVLHLAPCLDKLTVTDRVLTLALTTTRCAVASLVLCWADTAAEYAAEYASAVRNQESLGRLRRLTLDTSTPYADERVRAWRSCPSLESIEVLGGLPSTIHPVVLGPPRPSLTEFRCDLVDNSISFVHSILTAHAATLEDVYLHTNTSEETTTATLLSAMPRLGSLQCNGLLWGLQDVAACKALTEFSITLHEDLHKVETVAKLLRRAKQLRRVHLSNCSEDFTTEHCAVLVEALASAGGSHLEQLSLEEFDDARPLLRVLPSLPALRHLSLWTESNDELLMSITPATAPALRLLEVGGDEMEKGGCPHAWVHGAAVKATLADNPSLHIQLWYTTGDKCQDCEACVTGCHREIKWGEEEQLGVYSHDPDKCPSPEYHTDLLAYAYQFPWFHV